MHVYHVLMYLNGVDDFATSENVWKTTLEQQDPVLAKHSIFAHRGIRRDICIKFFFVLMSCTNWQKKNIIVALQGKCT